MPSDHPSQHPAYVPTPDAIEQATARLRGSFTERETINRMRKANGLPKLPDERKGILIRCDLEERDILKAAAEAAGESLNTWILKTLLKKAGEDAPSQYCRADKEARGSRTHTRTNSTGHRVQTGGCGQGAGEGEAAA